MKNTKTTVNVSAHLRQRAAENPYKRAVVIPTTRDKNGRIAYFHLTFEQLDKESDYLAYGLKKIGITRGVRTILMVTPGIDFFVLIFALFKVGAVPVVVDPGMGIKRMVNCFKETKPKAFIGISKAFILKILFPNFFKSIRTSVTVGRRWFWGGPTLKDIRIESKTPFPAAETEKHETAAILFTTGSTGPAKGVIYTHGIFDAQIRSIKKIFNIGKDEIDLPTFPLFALFDPALGMTAVIPDMDPTKPGFVNPKQIIKPIIDHGITNMFASPALLNRVGKYGYKNHIKLPSLKRVVSAGAPASPANIERFSTMLNPQAEIHTPYGATEAMPITSISSREILAETKNLSEQGLGACVGRSIDGIRLRIIKIDDKPISNWSDDLLAQQGEVGEITASGNLVTRSYYKNPRADASAIIFDNNIFWRRMGDLGRIDEKGRLWFHGRKNHRVETKRNVLFTIPCETLFNNHKKVFRSALVGIGPYGDQKPVICIEPEPGVTGPELEPLKKELLEIAKNSELTHEINDILFHKAFPVDIRHNSKIFREKLAVWAEKELE